jgi:hypothetical protein
VVCDEVWSDVLRLLGVFGVIIADCLSPSSAFGVSAVFFAWIFELLFPRVQEIQLQRVA